MRTNIFAGLHHFLPNIFGFYFVSSHIANLQGQKIESVSEIMDHETLGIRPINALTKGIYFLHITTKDQNTVKSIIVNAFPEDRKFLYRRVLKLIKGCILFFTTPVTGLSSTYTKMPIVSAVVFPHSGTFFFLEYTIPSIRVRLGWGLGAQFIASYIILCNHYTISILCASIINADISVLMRFLSRSVLTLSI